MRRFSLRLKIVLAFLALTTMTFAVAVTVRFGLDTLNQHQGRLAQLREFQAHLISLDALGPHAALAPRSGPSFEETMQRLRALGQSLGDHYREGRGELARRLEGVLAGLVHYRQAYLELSERYARARELQALRPLLEASRSETSEERPELHRQRHLLMDHLLLATMRASQEPAPGRVQEVRAIAQELRGRVQDPGLLRTLDATLRQTEEAYLNHLAIREREAFLGDTAERFHTVSNQAVAALEAASQGLQRRIDSTVNALLAASVLLTLGLWLAATRYFQSFLVGQRQAVDAIRSGRYDYPLPFASNDELGDLSRVMKDLASSLEESENWFRHAVHAAPFPTIIHAEDGEVLAVNRVWTELSGYRPEQLPTITDWARLAYGTGSEAVRAGVSRLFALDRRVDEGEFQVRTASGAVRDWFFSTAPLGRLGDGRRVVISSAVDLTEQNRLRRELEFTNALVAQSQEPLYALDPEDGFRLVFVNDAACRHFGYSRERLLQMRVGDWDADDPEAWLAEHWSPHHPPRNVFERVHRTGDGRQVPVEIVASHMVTDGRSLEIGAIRDLTERKAAEAALAEAWERLERALASIPDAVLIYDGELRIRYANPAAGAVTGRPVEELLERRDTELWPSETCALFLPALERALGAGTPQRVEGALRFAGDRTRRVQMRLVPVSRGDGGVTEVLSVMVDLTEVREAEDRARDSDRERAALARVNARLQEVDRLKSLFIASMSHELRTPLNSIIGFTAVLLQGMAGPLPEEQRDMLQRVNRSGKHLLELINDVIDVSKVEAGKVDPHLERVVMADVVQEALDTLRPEAEAKGLPLHLDLEAAPVVVSDRRRVLQCLLNLLSNAVKYSQSGAVTVTVSERDARVEVAVQDTGIGVSPEDSPLLFRQFSRIDSPLTRTTLGTGLGLYLSRKVAVEVLGGDLSFSPVPEGGSRFTLTLPKEPSHEDRPGH